MSGNVALVRAVYDQWERGDFSSAEWADPDIELVMGDGPTPGTWKGRAAMSSAWREALSAFDGLSAEAEEIRELDSTRVLVLTTNRTGRGKASKVELGSMRTRGANVFEIRDGLVTRLTLYWDRARCPEITEVAGAADEPAG